ncbi:MAG TPA: hypothetical protein VH482_37970 [Thermomicrobiales bacterium]|jgi:hypothetical protein
MSATRRLERGRGHSYELDGRPVDGVTSILSNGVPKPALINWAANETAAYAVNHWDELGQREVAERLRTLERARFIGRDSAAVRGTEIHRLAHRLAAGELVDVPDPLIGHVDAYLTFVEEWQPEEIVVEAVVGNRAWNYMGTLDLLARLGDGRLWLLDWKTGTSGVWPEAALQLAAYRYAEFFLDVDGREQPLPEVEEAGCVWLRADGYDVVPVDTSPETFRTFLYAAQVARFVKSPRTVFVWPALSPPTRRSVA